MVSRELEVSCTTKLVLKRLSALRPKLGARRYRLPSPFRPDSCHLAGGRALGKDSSWGSPAHSYLRSRQQLLGRAIRKLLEGAVWG